MFIIIAGGGIVGLSLTKVLSKEHDVVVIDKDYENCEKISSKYGAVAIQGDATNINTLKDAGIEKCSYALGVMGDDAQNLLFSLLCKNYSVKHIFVRMRDPEYRTAYKLAGATNIGHSVQMMVNRFVLEIVNPEVRRVASLGGGKAEVSIISLTQESASVGKKIMDISSNKAFPEDVVIAGIFDKEEDTFVVPRGHTELTENNQIFLVGPHEAILKAYKYLVK